jgi:diaminopimelate epimerase
MIVEFFKYQGTGNDFVILDNRDKKYSSLTEKEINFLCQRQFGIGADGLMMLQEKDGFDFEMKYFNADGKEGSMCGNGGRCIVQFAKDLNLIEHQTLFIASDGPHDAVVAEAGYIELKMINVKGIERRGAVSIINTGSPHYIQPVIHLAEIDIEKEGKAIRYNNEFNEMGVNVNFIEKINNVVHIRTYERGVEAETLSCGTGATAAALSVADNKEQAQSIAVQTQGGLLNIKFKITGADQFEDIWLCGPAQFVFRGTITL